MTGILSAVGEAKVAGSIGGTAINFAVIRIGDGNGAAIAPNRLMTDLVRRVGGAYPVTASARDPDNPTHWRVTTEIPAGQGPFTLREIAVFDAAGDMLAIAPHPVVEFTGPGGDQISIITDIVFPVSGTANVSVTISPSAAVPLARNLRPFFMAVESASTLAPPATPAAGVTYIVPADATGAWAGQAGNLAQWTGESWSVASAPVGHIVCVMDQAVGAEGRFQRRTAGGWTTAKATDAAYGVARLATAQEVTDKTPGVAVPADKLKWVNVGDRPTEFPPAAHHHDERYFTETEADGRFVRLNPAGGATQAVSGPIQTPRAFLGALSGTDAQLQAYYYGGLAFLEAYQAANVFNKLPIALNPWGGNVLIGTTTDSGAKLDVNGNAIVRGEHRIKAASYPKMVWEGTTHASGNRKWQAYVTPDGRLRMASLNDAESVEPLGLALSVGGPIELTGFLGANGDIGTSSKVLRGGASAGWVSLADLEPTLDYRQMIAPGTGWYPTASINAWAAVPLNTLAANAIPGASAAAGLVTLPAGTYEVACSVTLGAGGMSRWQTRLRDRTAAATVMPMALQIHGSSTEAIGMSVGRGRFTLTQTSQIALELYTESAFTTGVGFSGFASGENVMHSQIFITKKG